MKDTLWLSLFFTGIVSALLLVAGTLGSIVAWVALLFRTKKRGIGLVLVPVLRASGFEEKAQWLVSARNRCYLTAGIGIALFVAIACISFPLGYTFGPN
jgi:hypothetical protein